MVHLIHDSKTVNRTMKAGVYLVVFLKKDVAVEDILTKWAGILLKNTKMKGSDIGKSHTSLQFVLDNVPIALLPILPTILIPRKGSFLLSVPSEIIVSSPCMEVRRPVNVEQRRMLEALLELYS